MSLGGQLRELVRVEACQKTFRCNFIGSIKPRRPWVSLVGQPCELVRVEAFPKAFILMFIGRIKPRGPECP